jgi:hypothetical protein
MWPLADADAEVPSDRSVGGVVPADRQDDL